MALSRSPAGHAPLGLDPHHPAQSPTGPGWDAPIPGAIAAYICLGVALTAVAALLALGLWLAVRAAAGLAAALGIA